MDFHLHTTASDGKFTPEQIVDMALKSRFEAIAITDHETSQGVLAAIDHLKRISREKDLQIIPGIEISCDEKERGFYEIHILGLNVEPNHACLKNFTQSVEEARVDEKKEMVKKLNSLGYNISYEEVESLAEGMIGRPHIAQILIKNHASEFTSISEVFDKLIGRGKPAYVERTKPTVAEAIQLIHEAGGKAYLAHPFVFEKKDVDDLVKIFIECGGEGIETHYPYHPRYEKNVTEEKSRQYNESAIKIAKEHNLLQTAGTDCHGDNDKIKMGVNASHTKLAEMLKHILEVKP